MSANNPSTPPSTPPSRSSRIRAVAQVLWRIVSTPFRLFYRFVRYLQDPSMSWRKRLVVGPLGLAGFGAGALLLYLLLLLPFTPSIGDLKQLKVQHPTVLLAADGTELMRFQSLNREWVGLDDINTSVLEALVATEDHRFYQHFGIDLWRLAGATVHTLRGDRQGGSTLTMQLARNLYPQQIGRTVSVHRKLKEMVTALKIEWAYEKDEILETYLNTVPFLYNAYGIEMAARTYFSTTASELRPEQAAVLVGMLKATSSYNPRRRPERALARRNVVLRQMERRGYLEASEATRLMERPLRLQFERQPLPESRAPHFSAHVRRWLNDWADEEGYNLYTDGLRVHTTLDPRLQQLAENAVTRQGNALQAVADVEWSQSSNPLRARHPEGYLQHRNRRTAFDHFWSTQTEAVTQMIRSTDRYASRLATGATSDDALRALRSDRAFMDSLRTVKSRLETGFVAMDPRTGHVKAWVGSRNYVRDQYDKVAQARRQPGSTFKPFVYATALERGYSAYDRLPDRPIEITMSEGDIWRPVNAGGFSNEDVTLRDALATSKNTISAQLITDVGPRRTARLARKMGVRESTLEAVPSLALGTSPVTLLEMTTAYATIARGGTYIEPLVVTQIDDAEGTPLVTFSSEADRVLSEASAHTLIDMMRGVIDDGTGQRVRHVFGVRADVAGKTGTTQDNADGWFLMMHPQLVAGSWVGFNDPRVRFRSDYWGQGAHNALYVVGDVYRQALRRGYLNPTLSLGPVSEPPAEQPTFWANARDWFDNLFDRDAAVERPLAPEPPSAPDSPRRIADVPQDTRTSLQEQLRQAGERVRDLDRVLQDRLGLSSERAPSSSDATSRAEARRNAPSGTLQDQLANLARREAERYLRERVELHLEDGHIHVGNRRINLDDVRINGQRLDELRLDEQQAEALVGQVLDQYSRRLSDEQRQDLEALIRGLR